MRAKAKVPERPVVVQSPPEVINPATQLPDPLDIPDPPEPLPCITQRDVVGCANAWLVYRLAKADFELKRAALTLKLIQNCQVERGAEYVHLEGSNLIFEEHNSRDERGRPITDTEIVPAWGEV